MKPSFLAAFSALTEAITSSFVLPLGVTPMASKKASVSSSFSTRIIVCRKAAAAGAAAGATAALRPASRRRCWGAGGSEDAIGTIDSGDRDPAGRLELYIHNHTHVYELGVLGRRELFK
eukprot:SAG22_NODE_87_length_21437_cov_14.162480_4_plen_119_part_00